jgi:ABC-type antimicrobial peptide transport system permease subunit
VRSVSLSEPVEPFYYFPEAQWPFDEPTFVVRTSSDPAAIANSVRQAVRSLDPELPIFDTQPLSEIVSMSVAQQRFLGRILSLFSILAVALSAIGIYGVVAYGVEQRRRELGVRLALGASQDRVLSLVLGDGLRLAVVGGALGIAGALALTGMLRTVLYGVRPGDPLTLLSVALLLVAVAVAASLAPAIRAARLHPTSALRES